MAATSICILLVFVITTASSLLSIPFLHVPEKFRTIVPLLLLLCLSFIAVYPFGNYYFGEEYEDAYIYAAHARNLLYHNHGSPTPFLTVACSIGSLVDCVSTATYSAHLIGYPSLLFLTFSLLGYSPHTVLFVSVFFSIISTGLLYFLARMLIRSPLFCCSVVSIYLLTPIMNVFHSTGFAETTSSTFALLFILSYFSVSAAEQEDSPRIRSIALLWIVSISSLMLATLIKRENLLLLLLPMLDLASDTICSRRTPERKDVKCSSGDNERRLFRFFKEYRKYVLVILTVSSIALFFHCFIDISESVGAETGEIGRFPFSLRFFPRIFPQFIDSYMTFRWFSVFPYFCLIGVLLLPFQSSSRRRFLMIFALFVAYIVIYSTHYRTYDFLQTGKIVPAQTLRYTDNFFPLFCIISAIPLFHIFKMFQSISSEALKVMSMLGLVPVLYLMWQTQLVRQEHAAFEESDRIKIGRALSDLMRDGDTLITDMPILFQLIASPKLRLIDLGLAGTPASLPRLEDWITTGRVFYLERHNQQGQDRSGLRDGLKFLESFEKEEVIKDETFTLLRLESERANKR